MRIVVVGAGALGGLVGAKLHEGGQDVVLLEINRARVRLIADEGLVISQEGAEERCVPVNIRSSCEGLETADLVFVSVKSYQTEQALQSVLPVVGATTRVLSMQNGIGNTQLMAEMIGPERVMSGITYHSIQHTGPNRLRYREGIKPIQIAPFDGKIVPEIEAVGDVFQRAGLKTDVVENIDHVVWQKLLHNAVVNPVSALTGLTCREMLDDEHVMAFMRELCLEIVAVMRARGIPIVDEEDPFRPVIGSLKALGKNRPSMWQDLVRGNLTEIDSIVESIVSEAERVGAKAPHCWAIARFIRSRERQKILRKQEISRKARAGHEVAATRSVAAMRVGKGGGMPTGRVPLKVVTRLKELLRDYYRDLDAASGDDARRVACCTALGPVELVRAFGMTPYFPENHAALIGASRTADKYIRRALSEGFSQFVSSAMMCDIGALLEGDSPLVPAYGVEGPPEPDAVVYSTNNGHPLINWFEYYGGYYSIPVFGLHPPAALHTVERIDVDAASEQLLRLSRQLEQLTGERLDLDRLAQSVHHSARAGTLWEEIIDLAQTVPSPLTYFDMLIHVAPMVVLRGTPEAVEYYSELKAEVEQRVGDNVAAVPGERYRLYWEGPPIWFALRSLAELFQESGIAVVGSSFGEAFTLGALDPANPVDSMARVYTGIFANRSDDYKAGYLAQRFEELGVDAALYHDSRTCPEHSNVRFGLHHRLQGQTAVPSVVVEADSYDQRLLSLDRLRGQLLDLLEREHVTIRERA
jgi:2-dehydropantoate 2-reductase